MSFIQEALNTDVADKEGNYIERFNAEISAEKHTDSPFSLVNGKTHLTNSLGRPWNYTMETLTYYKLFSPLAVRPLFGRHRHIQGLHRMDTYIHGDNARNPGEDIQGDPGKNWGQVPQSIRQVE